MRGTGVLRDLSAGPTAGSDSRRCNPESRFQACSISKLVVSCVVLALVESGAVDLHTPISSWLDDLPSAWSSITLHQLLSNTSGLGHWGDIPGLPRLLTSPPPLDELLALIESAPLVSSPGSSWRYSGPGYLTAARVVEAVTQRPYRDTAQDLVLRPAGMTGSSSGTPAADDPNLAVGHD